MLLLTLLRPSFSMSLHDSRFISRIIQNALEILARLKSSQILPKLFPPNPGPKAPVRNTPSNMPSRKRRSSFLSQIITYFCVSTSRLKTFPGASFAQPSLLAARKKANLTSFVRLSKYPQDYILSCPFLSSFSKFLDRLDR